MSLPEHYRHFFRTQLRFALIMIAVALLTGICFQESAKKVTISQAVPVGAHLEYILGLALVHGHTFVLGVLMPLALSWVLFLGLSMGLPALSALTLRASSALYLPGVVVVVLLMLVKSYHFVLGVRHGGTDFSAINDSFMGANHTLRAGLYGLSHAAMAAGLAIFAVGFWRAMNQSTKTA
jgi:hypothetical protein